MGSESINAPVDGLLVVGGYDTSRVGGEWTTFSSSENCSSCVTVTEMTYEYEGGAQSLFANSSDTLPMRLEPYMPGLQLPQSMFDRLAIISNGTYDPDIMELRYDINNTPTGNISVTLSNGFRTTILNHEAFGMPRQYNSDGVYSIINDTLFTSHLWNISEPEQATYLFGLPYLTMNYMLMDHKNYELKLAPARREPYPSGSGPVISAICRPTYEPTSGTNVTTPVPTPHRQSTHAGAIAGAVVGGILGLALILGGFGYLFWKSKSTKKAQTELPGVPTAKIKNELDDTHYNELGTPPMQQQIWAMRNRSLNVGSPAELSTGPAEPKDAANSDVRNGQSASSEPTEVPSDPSYR